MVLAGRLTSPLDQELPAVSPLLGVPNTFYSEFFKPVHDGRSMSEIYFCPYKAPVIIMALSRHPNGKISQLYYYDKIFASCFCSESFVHRAAHSTANVSSAAMTKSSVNPSGTITKACQYCGSSRKPHGLISHERTCKKRHGKDLDTTLAYRSKKLQDKVESKMILSSLIMPA